MNSSNIIKTSFFDTKNYVETDEERNLCFVPPQECFWLRNKDKKVDLRDIFAFVNDDVLYEGFLEKKGKKTRASKQHYYRLYKDRLERYQNPVTEDPDKILILRGVKCEMLNITEDEDFKESDDKYLVIFTLNKQFSILYCQHPAEFQQWQNGFSQTCILSYFGKYYKNQKVIGRGTFAKVLLSKHLQTNEEYAVKTFDKKNLLSSKTSNKARIGLINEIHLMMQLDNPNIIKLYEVYEGEYHIYLVMELLNGGELFDRIMNKGHYVEKDAAILIYKLLSSLVYLHQMNIMHRDIKPENLILKDEDGFDLKLADFGLAEFVNQKHHLFKRCGTPGYVAPEILDDKPYDTQVDVFSAGVILYILLTGCSPFYGETYNEILIKNKKCQINFDLEELKVKVSNDAIDLLTRMLQKDPKKRYTAKDCLKHKWIVENTAVHDNDICPTSPYKNKKQSINQALQQMKLQQSNDTSSNLKNNLGHFQRMNKDLQTQTKPENLTITTPMKYGEIYDQDDGFVDSPLKRKQEQFSVNSSFNNQKQTEGFSLKPKKVKD